MILDTSAVVPILRGESDAEQLATLIEVAHRVRISTATVLEASLVLGPARQVVLDEFLVAAHAEVMSFGEPQLGRARAAHTRYGRGSGSPARLSYGDCFTYALAATLDEPLLFTGDKFSRTDVVDARE